jgi:hypothetical protein
MGNQSDLKMRWLPLARMGWVFVSLLALAMFIVGIPVRLEQFSQFADTRSLRMLGMTASSYGILSVSLDLLFIFGHFSIAWIIFLRRRDDWMVLSVAYALVTAGIMVPLALTYQHAEVHWAWRTLINLVVYIALMSAILLLYLFPDGRFVPGWTQSMAILWAVLCIPAIFFPNSPISLPQWPRLIQVFFLLTCSGTGVFAQIYRYFNVSNPIQRQQAKWATLGLTASGLGPFAYFLPFVILPSLSQQFVPNALYQRMGAEFFSLSYYTRLINSAGFNLFTLIFPLSFAIAIMRYRLWDIDILINRALVYTSLSGTLLIGYLLSVIVLTSILRPLTGENSNQLVTAISTLVIAASFAPLRRRIQRAIDHRFYRSRYNAARTVESFGESLREEVDLNTLSGRLVAVVDETMQPKQITLWIKSIRGRGE